MSNIVNQTALSKALNGNNHLKDPNRFGSTDQKECKYRNSWRTNYIDFQYFSCTSLIYPLNQINNFISVILRNRNIQFDASSSNKLNLNGALEIVHTGEYVEP